ncbi:MAG: thioredoxin fold domain-containing protein [Xanthomonadales bacterium]|nr:thioredoxin fold domain-containing protein [Xanthomonadales bacterium]
MRKIRISTPVILILTAFMLSPVIAADSYDAVRAAVQALSPGAEHIAVAETPVKGLIEVQIDSEVVYFSEDGKYLLQGRLFNLATREDLTDNAKSGIRKELMGSYDTKSQIIFSPEKADYELTVFTDIDCGYCRKLHDQVADYNAEGISINYMAFPRAGIGSDSYKKYVSVWCAGDKKKAMTEAKEGDDPVPMVCDNPIKEQYDLGVKLGVSGTPAMVTSDGKMIPGYVPPKQLKQRLDAMYQSVE